jgi:hypothetical protein
MKRAEIEGDQMPGQDSFLDVITNIVGILILLVLVVGLRTSRSVRDARTAAPCDSVQSGDKVQQACNSALSMELDVRDLVHRLGNAHEEADAHDAQRLWLNTAIAQAEQAIADRRSKLSTDEQRDFDVRRKLKDVQATYDDLTRQQIALASREPASEEIRCEPTPMAKAVTGKELHLLLSDDFVAIVPFDELLEAMKKDFTENEWRLKNQDEMVRTIGPINGFRLKFWFVKEDIMRSSDAGTYMLGNITRFSRCYFLPITTPIGEPMADALRPNSELFQRLRHLRSDGTTITIWIHPGNYAQLLQLKREIRAAGFQIAVRPLPKGMPIGAARHGSRSLSE